MIEEQTAIMGNGNSLQNLEDPAASIFGKCSTLSDLLDHTSHIKDSNKCEDYKVPSTKSGEYSTNTSQKRIEGSIDTMPISYYEEDSQNDSCMQSRKYSLSSNFEYLIPEVQRDRCKSDPAIIINSPPNRISSSLSSNHIAPSQTSW